MLTTLASTGDSNGGSLNPNQTPKRAKYREQSSRDGSAPGPVNIMHDKRVHRGSVFASQPNSLSQPDPIELQRQSEARRRAAAKRRAEQQRRPRTPDPVDGRKDIDVQTELYLEELSDKIPEANAQTQTDAFLDRPISPLYVPVKSGIDAETQVEEGELFDFDFEVQPILQVLVGKTLEQALLEVMEEDELEIMKKHQEEFQTRRNAELAETQRMEEAERRRLEEKDRRMKQEREILKAKQETAEKIAARAFAQGYLAGLIPSVFNTLYGNGYFFDSVEREVENVFLPWLTLRVERGLDDTERARALVDDIIFNAVITSKNLTIRAQSLANAAAGASSSTP